AGDSVRPDCAESEQSAPIRTGAVPAKPARCVPKSRGTRVARRRRMSPFIAELVGTTLLMLFGCGVVAGVVLEGTKNHGAGWLAITITWGLAVAMPLYVAGGVHMNPAVTIGLAAVGEFPWERVPGFVLAQMLGAILGAALVWVQYLPHWRRTVDSAMLLVAFTPPPSSANRWHSVAS